MSVVAVVGYYEPWYVQIIKGIVIFVVGLSSVPLVLIIERKLIGRFQGRYGPNRVGPYGLMQPMADILKLLTKEQSRPFTSVGFLYAVAPLISILTAVVIEIVGASANSQPIEVRGRNCSLVSSLTMSAIGCSRPKGPTRLGP